MTLLLLLRCHNYGAIIKGYAVASNTPADGAAASDAAKGAAKSEDA